MFETFENKKKKLQTPWLIFTAAAFCFTVFLFYIDEGNYSLKGFTKWYTWIVLLIYMIPQILTQFGLFHLFNKKLNAKESALFSVLVGIPIGVALVIFGFYFIS